jgi:hypothetical protein
LFTGAPIHFLFKNKGHTFFRQPKVRDLAIPVPVEEDIVGLQVAVDNLVLVQVLDPGRNLEKHPAETPFTLISCACTYYHPLAFFLFI